MPAETLTPSLRLAVLIDADNMPPKSLERVFKDVTKLGRPVILRVYGDMAKTHAKGWVAASERFALLSRQQFVHTTGKNATDISMVIDAMDIMAGDRVEGFCLVSSDSDFTPLAMRLREQGLKVYGFGAAKAAKCFRSACDGFVAIDRVAEDARAPDNEIVSHLVEAAVLIRKALAASTANDGLATLSWVGDYIKRQAPKFSATYCGTGKLKKLVLQTEQFEVSNDHRVRPRRQQASA